jgi:hypothetical protein
VIAFEGQDPDGDEKEALVKSRHVTVDWNYMGPTVFLKRICEVIEPHFAVISISCWLSTTDPRKATNDTGTMRRLRNEQRNVWRRTRWTSQVPNGEKFIFCPVRIAARWLWATV